MTTSITRPMNDIGPATEVPGYQPDERADHERDRDADEADLEIDAGGVDDPGENVAPELVGAEPMRQAWRLEPAFEPERGGIVRRDRRGEDGERGDREDAGQPDAERPAAGGEPVSPAGSGAANVATSLTR